MSIQKKFLDLKGRKIQMSDRGAYFVRKNGKKVYGIKAAFRKAAGKPVKITPLTAKKVPCPIRPVMRKARSTPVAANFMKGMTTTSANIKRLRRLNTN
jgi:hypothetical protein